MSDIIPKMEVDNLFEKLSAENPDGGYFFNPDEEFTISLLESLLVNEKRYGYRSCPCRLAKGARADDLDIICPCYYRDADVAEFGTCYCGLYVSRDVSINKKPIKQIPERRLDNNDKMMNNMENNNNKKPFSLSHPVWRCEVCGYLCARDEAPDICPICKAEKDRFTRFI